MVPSAEISTVPHGLWSSAMYLVASLSWTPGSLSFHGPNLNAYIKDFEGYGELGEMILCTQGFWRFMGVEGESWGDFVWHLLNLPLFNTLISARAAQDLIHFLGLHLMNSGPSYLICSLFVSFPLCSLCPPMRIMFFPILMWELGVGGGRNNTTKLVLYHSVSLQIFPYRKGIFTRDKLLEWKSRRWWFCSRTPISMFPWLWVKWDGGEVRQRVGLGRRRVDILPPQIFNQTSSI